MYGFEVTIFLRGLTPRSATLHFGVRPLKL
jgi:hypothetical protein